MANIIKFGGGSGSSGSSGNPITMPVIGKDFNWTGGDNTYQVLNDGDNNWRIRFLSSGVFTPLTNMIIDVFLVGGGASGGKYSGDGGGGGGGYTKTVKSIVLTSGISYSVVVGSGGATLSSNANGNDGGKSSAFSASVSGGMGGGGGRFSGFGGDGGSGGGARGTSAVGNKSPGAGGTDGSDGGSNAAFAGGTGQGTTTREFGEINGQLYSGGGAGSYKTSAGTAGAGGGGSGSAGGDNTGGGGSGDGYAGGSGIVIIRNHRS